MQILAVNGAAVFSGRPPQRDQGIEDARPGRMTMEFQNDDVVKTVSLDYHGGTREPHLERDMSKPDILAQILAARAK